MQSTQSAQPWLRPQPAPKPDESEADPSAPHNLTSGTPRVDAPPRERDARREIARLRAEIEQLVQVRADADARETVDSALESVTRLQIVTANVDACGPPPASFMGAALVALADSHLRGHADAIERGMTYTGDNQLRLLHGQQD
jgi:hypothetical protein